MKIDRQEIFLVRYQHYQVVHQQDVLLILIE